TSSIQAWAILSLVSKSSYHVLVSEGLRERMGAVPFPASTTKSCGVNRSGEGGSHEEEVTSGVCWQSSREAHTGRGHGGQDRDRSLAHEVGVLRALGRAGAAAVDDTGAARARAVLGRAVPGVPGAHCLRGMRVRLGDW